ncbi:MAG: hypothetical protein LWX83_15540, partial [Anaerolineae bacterium]|nr:hypothetical protein [Anaerolineae bacterium]
WNFETDALVWQNQCLSRAYPTDLLVIDELGPLEFERGLGLQSAFQLLKAGLYQMALVIVRPEYVGKFISMNSTGSSIEVISIAGADMDETACILLKRILSFKSEADLNKKPEG